MAPYLESLVAAGVVPSQLPASASASASTSSASSPTSASDLLASLREQNQSELARLETKLTDAQTDLGESEVSDALRERAAYLARIGDKDRALEVHEKAIEKTAGKGAKIDLVLQIVRVAMFHNDHDLIAQTLDRAQK